MLRTGSHRFLLICGLLSIFVFHSCKVVVEDPYGNRIGDIDSLNWDSLLSSPGIIPGYSSWVWPLSSYTPWSSFVPWSSYTPRSSSLLSSSINPILFSSSTPISSSSLEISSSSLEISSSSGEDQSSSSSAICQYFMVHTYSKDILYTWDNLYSDGYVDRIIAADTFSYPGSSSIKLDFYNWNVPLSNLGMPVVSTALFCDNQQEYYLADQNNIIKVLAPSLDTVYLNYGAEARDPLVSPSISIADKESLLALFDTAYACQTIQAEPTLMHFYGDSLRFAIQGSELLQAKGFWKTSPQISIKPDGTLTDTATLSWQLRIRNRFGYRDQLRLKTFIIPDSIPGTCFE